MNNRSIAKTFLLLISISIIAGCDSSAPKKDPNEMVLNLYLNSKIKTLDPIAMRDTYTNMVATQIFESLYQSHYLKRPYVYVPLLAESMPQVSDDTLTYTIKIKKGVLFQDDECFPDSKGRELKTQDFVFSFKRVANIKNLSENWPFLDEKIVGLDEFREYTKTCKTKADVDYSRQIEGLQTPDDYTLIIKLKKPWPQFLGTALTDVLTSAVAKEAVDYYGKDILSYPVGTGPFKLKKWARGSYIELVRNPKFRGEPYPSEGAPGDAEAGYLDDAGKMMPFADKVVWTIIEEAQPAWFLFLQGKIDAKAISKDNWDETLTATGELTPAMKDRNIQLKVFSDPTTFWLGFNMTDPILGKNKPLRQAINRCFNRERFIQLFFGGRHEIAHGLIPPMMPAYDPNIKDKGYARYDPNEARELVKEAEKIHGGKLPVFKLSTQGTDSFYRQFGQLVTKFFNDVGLEVEVLYMDWPTFQEKAKAGDVQMFLSGVGAGVPDSQGYLSLFYSKNWPPGMNLFHYKESEYEKLYEKIEVMPFSPERVKLYRKMELMMLEDCPAAFTNHRIAYALHHDWYKNYKPHVFQYGLAKYRRIDLKKRAEYKELLKKLK
ncbi:ABC transporter substrate-binding protein [Planctomycetota bacterium]